MTYDYQHPKTLFDIMSNIRITFLCKGIGAVIDLKK